MQKLKELSDSEIETISRHIANTFSDYKYNTADKGLVKYIPNREDMFIYINAIVQASYKSGMLYTTSENREGYLILAGEGIGIVQFIDGIKMILAEKKALGGWRKMKSFISACFSDGNTIEYRMRKSKRQYIKIEVLVVRPEFQKQGYMRKMMEFVYELAKEKEIPVILDTDDMDKSLRYRHLGMKLDRIRHCGDDFHIYDLIYENHLKETENKLENNK